MATSYVVMQGVVLHSINVFVTKILQHLTMTAEYVSGIPCQYSGQSIIIAIGNGGPGVTLQLSNGMA